MYYKISHGSVTLGNNTVLEDINFCVKDNEKIGIVGRNGSGKTTLLKAIASEYEINSGYEEVDIISSGDFNIGYVKQNDGYSLNMKMIDYIRSSFKDILDIERKLNTLEDEMSTHYDEKIVSKYNDLLSRYEYMGGYKYKKEIEGFSREARQLLKQYNWPGNVRELRNVIDRAAIICEGSEILPQHLPEYIQAYRKSSPLESSDGYYHYEIACLERQLITKALRDNGGNRQAAARQLGIHRSLLYKKMKDLGIHE